MKRPKLHPRTYDQILLVGILLGKCSCCGFGSGVTCPEISLIFVDDRRDYLCDGCRRWFYKAAT